MSIINLLNLLNNPIFTSIFVSISSDPTLPNSWNNLYSNPYFRFLILFIMIYQANSNISRSFATSTLTMIFYYIISSKEERKINFKFVKSIKNMMNNLRTFIYFVIFLIVAIKIDELLK